MELSSGLIAILVTVLLALVGFAFGYGILTAKQRADRFDIEELKTCYRQIDSKMDDIRNTVTRIDTRLNSK